MSNVIVAGFSRRAAFGAAQTSTLLRSGLLLAVAVSAVAGFTMTDSHMAAQALSAAGEDLTRLLRGMAAIKMGMALVTLAAVVWRLSLPVRFSCFIGYLIACSAMAVGPGLIWDLVHVGRGAALLDGGLLGAIILLWRDPAVMEHCRIMTCANVSFRPKADVERRRRGRQFD